MVTTTTTVAATTAVSGPPPRMRRVVAAPDADVFPPDHPVLEMIEEVLSGEDDMEDLRPDSDADTDSESGSSSSSGSVDSVVVRHDAPPLSGDNCTVFICALNPLTTAYELAEWAKRVTGCHVRTCVTTLNAKGDHKTAFVVFHTPDGAERLLRLGKLAALVAGGIVSFRVRFVRPNRPMRVTCRSEVFSPTPPSMATEFAMAVIRHYCAMLRVPYDPYAAMQAVRAPSLF